MQHKLCTPWCIILVIAVFFSSFLDARRSKKRKQPDSIEQIIEIPTHQLELDVGHIEPFAIDQMQDMRSYHVQVLLAQSAHDESVWIVSAEKGVIFADAWQDEEKKLENSDTTYEINFYDGFFYINKKRLKQMPCFIKPQEGYIAFQGKSYHGCLMLHVQDGCGMLINYVDLEDYVCSVLKTEGWPGWPLEMYKVLAITCRTYVMAMIQEARVKNRAYHVHNTNKHQTYEGVHGSALLRRAVDDTKGIFLTHNNRPILAMFDICCGGVVPAGISGFNFDKAPYLARHYPCTHCKQSKSYAWNVTLSKDELITYLQKEYPQLTCVRDVKITKKDKAGLVHEAVFKGSRAVCSLTGRKIYSCIKGIKSYCFGVTKKGNAIIFSGRGFGHHLGLCQWGARSMVDDGWHHTSILSFYYPETKLMRLT